MTCKNHINRQAFNQCRKCGDYVCDECNLVVNGESICKTCATEMIETNSGASITYSIKRKSSAFLLFCFSGLPGANYMYLGLIRRGVLVMIAFLSSIFIAGNMNFGSGISFIIPLVIFCASFFESFKIRKILSRGVPVEDSIDGIINSLSKYKGHIILGLIFFVGLEFISGISYLFNYGSFMYHIIRIIKIIAGICMVFFGLSMLKKSGDEKVIKTYEDSSAKTN